MGYEFKRQETGRIESIASFWGNTEFKYSENGALESITAQRDGRTASAELAAGRIRRVTGFDEGVTDYQYAAKNDRTGRLTQITCANGLELKHDYDEEGRLDSVTVGAVRRVRLEYDTQGRITAYVMEPQQD